MTKSDKPCTPFAFGEARRGYNKESVNRYIEEMNARFTSDEQALRDEISRLKKLSDSQKKELDSAADGALPKELSALKAELEKAKKQNAELNETLRQREQEAKRLNESIFELKAELTTLEHKQSMQSESAGSIKNAENTDEAAAKADSVAAQIIGNAEKQAAEIRAKAEKYSFDLRQNAQTEADTIREKARKDSEKIMAAAKADADAVTEKAESAAEALKYNAVTEKRDYSLYGSAEFRPENTGIKENGTESASNRFGKTAPAEDAVFESERIKTDALLASRLLTERVKNGLDDSVTRCFDSFEEMGNSALRDCNELLLGLMTRLKAVRVDLADDTRELKEELNRIINSSDISAAPN